MRILIVTASYPPVLGGLQTATHALARHLMAQGHQVLVVANRYPRILPRHETLDGVPVQRWLLMTPNRAYLRQGRPDLLAAACAAFPLGLARLARLMQAFQPDVVNVHFPDVQVPFILWLRRRFSFRLVTSLHGDDVERWFSGRMGGAQPPAAGVSPMLDRLRALLEASDAVTACSQFLLNRAIQIAPVVAEKGHTLHNGIDPARFADRAAYQHPRPYILSFGRLTHAKGFDRLLDAFARVADRYAGVDLVLAGDGELRMALRDQAGQLGIAERVALVGHAPQQQIVRLLNGCRFVVVPSRQESFGIAALEALAAGKPVLATRIGGIVELAEAFPAAIELIQSDIESICDGLDRWLDRIQETSASQATRDAVARQYSWQQAGDRYAALLRGPRQLDNGRGADLAAGAAPPPYPPTVEREIH